METYQQYYDHCKSLYKGEFTGSLPLNELTVKIHPEGSGSFDWPDNYSSKIKNIHDYCKLKIEKREGLFDPEHENIILLNHFRSLSTNKCAPKLIMCMHVFLFVFDPQIILNPLNIISNYVFFDHLFFYIFIFL